MTKSFSSAAHPPLAEIIRPQNLAEFVGQSHLVGPGKPLRIAIQKGQVFSIIFWGPPGSGKTTLAQILAKASKAELFILSAVSAGKADVKKIVAFAQKHPLFKTILFLDEIHRFNKAQQDYLLPFVENGTLALIGATTQNPSFEVIPPLLSRCRVFVLEELSSSDIKKIVNRAVKKLNLPISTSALNWLVNMANGDARQAITVIDNASTLYGNLKLKSLKEALQNKFLRFDKKGEEHYNTISAFIKSMRASQPDAALYYLARMIESGEDPKFIARRMLIFASEDIGIANSSALLVANAVFDAVTKIGYPECSLNLAHGAVYLSLSKKSRACCQAISAALADAKQFGNLPIPLKIRNAPTQLMKDLGYSKGYQKYTKESLLPPKLKNKKYLNLPTPGVG